MHVPQERLNKAMFPMWFISVCARWLPFTLNREHVCKQGFLAKCLCLSNAWVSPFFDHMKGELE